MAVDQFDLDSSTIHGQSAESSASKPHKPWAYDTPDEDCSQHGCKGSTGPITYDDLKPFFELFGGLI